MKLMSVIILLSFVVGCGHLPKTKIDETDYIISNDSLRDTSVNLDEIRFYKDQYPEGIRKDGDLIVVEEEFKGRLQLLGSSNVSLQRGNFTSPFIAFTPKFQLYVNDDDISAVHKYCNAISFQSMVIVYNLFTHLYPWNYPCYFQDDYSGDDEEDIKYRKETIRANVRKKAKELGGNAVVGYNENVDGWFGGGYIVYID